jgi:hypothetical protein
MIIPCSIIFKMRNVLDKSVEELEIHILCSIFFFENRAFYQIMWKNYLGPGRPQITIGRMRIACWILKATNTHTHIHKLCNTYYISTATMVARARLYVTMHVHCLSCFS